MKVWLTTGNAAPWCCGVGAWGWAGACRRGFFRSLSLMLSETCGKEGHGETAHSPGHVIGAHYKLPKIIRDLVLLISTAVSKEQNNWWSTYQGATSKRGVCRCWVVTNMHPFRRLGGNRCRGMGHCARMAGWHRLWTTAMFFLRGTKQTVQGLTCEVHKRSLGSILKD